MKINLFLNIKYTQIIKLLFVIISFYSIDINSQNTKLNTDTIINGNKEIYPDLDTQGNNPFLNKENKNGIDFPELSNVEYITKYDPKTGNFNIYKRIGKIDVKLPYSMTMEEYMNEDLRNSMLDYWVKRSNEGQDQKKFSIFNPLSKIPLVGDIFGSNLINIKPQGIAQLKVGLSTNKIDNPTLQENLRKTTTFDFQEKIQMNIQGTVGDKLKLGINYNTDAAFEFENQINLEYEGKEDDILKSVEAGNVSLPLPGTLITGSQSLFGVKTEMKFGKLTMTTIFSQQKGETKVMDLQGGAQKQKFELRINEYDKNRHFFLSSFFRDLYNQAQSNYPIISYINVNKVEVWITNKAGKFNEARNILGFLDIGETGKNIYNTKLWSSTSGIQPVANNANNLYSQMTSTYSGVRDINQVTSIFRSLKNDHFVSGEDYEKIGNARLLTESEYTINNKLGFISLNSSLNADEVLCVAFEYDYNGKTYKVGEFTSDGVPSTETLFLKLLKSTNLTPSVKPAWDLMMKNIYAIGAYQLNSDDFKFDVAYVDDETGALINYFPDKVDGLEGELLTRMMGLDRLDDAKTPNPDGNFDYIEGQTVISKNGRIIFPYLEPFGAHLKKLLAGHPELQKKYVYEELYNSTQTVATQNAEQNKFRFVGTYKSSSSSEISLNAQNIPKGSVVVTAGGIKLTENVDYTVDYNFGTIKIINPGIQNSGTPISVSLESQSLFNMQTKTLMGTHLNYEFNKNFNIGGTVMHLRERPLTQKVSFGNEPISNTIYGFNTSYFTETQWLTDVLNKLPMLQLKEPSSISFEGEFAQLIPGHPDVIGKSGQAFIDDFEGTKISTDMRHWTAWSLASAPEGQTGIIPNSDLIDDVRTGYGRAKIAWYTIDPLFSRNNSLTPSHIKNDPDMQSYQYAREVYESEIFPNKEIAYGTPSNIAVFNVAYYPRERGPYNFDTNLEENGDLKNPESRWAGIQRPIEISDFEAANVEFIEFWVMDPFLYNNSPDRAGDLYFNLGNVSEDVLSDSRKFFEQGMPGPKQVQEVDKTNWGQVPIEQSLVNAFSNDAKVRVKQDVGLDGLNSEEEVNFYSDYINKITQMYNAGMLTKEAYDKINSDPSADNFHYFRGSDYDKQKLSINDRYKNFNNPEGNSTPSEYSPESYSIAATSLPDKEDINMDNTLSESENYYQYKVSLDPTQMEVGKNYITDMVDTLVTLKNNKKERVRWFQFRIPVTQPTKVVGNINDFRSIRFMRMFMHGFKDTTILRFATLDLVRSDWRRYFKDLSEIGEHVNPNTDTKFETGAINIEENASRLPINYILPPGVTRVIDPANQQVRQLNEQSLWLRVKDLNANDRKAVYKTMNIDIRQYGKIQMEVHAEELEEGTIGNNKVRAFIRIGTDSKDNYYEYEVPLEMTRHASNLSARETWPSQNHFEIDLSRFTDVKIKRNKSNKPINEVYSIKDGSNWVKIKGNPNMSNVCVIMLGVRSTVTDKPVSFETWFNELRLTDFNERGGWAAKAGLNIKLSDLGSVSLAGQTSTIGFGSIDKNVLERSQEDFYQYDIATTLELGKFTGAKSRLSIPFYYSYSKEVASPEYYPLDPDITLDDVIDAAESQHEKDSIKDLSQAVVQRKSINFTNVRLKPKNDKSKIYDISNLSATYSYNIETSHDVSTEKKIRKDYRGVLAYNFNNRPKMYTPFKNVKLFKNNAFKLVRDFNFYLMPTQLSYRMEMIRNYSQEQLRNVNNPNFVIPITVQKDFSWNRYFDLRFNLAKSLKLDFKSVTNSRIDEPMGLVDKDLRDEYDFWKDSIMTNILNGGRVTDYQHTFNVSYNVPINKVPLLFWTNSTVRYSGMYQWETAPSSTNESIEWGNVISNSQNIQASAQLNWTSLYNKSKYLKGLQRKYSPSNSSKRKKKKTVKFNESKVKLVKRKPFVINHKLKTQEIKTRIFDKNGRPVKGKTNILSNNKIEFIPDSSYTDASIMVTGTVEEKNSVLSVIKDVAALIVTGVKNSSVSYNDTRGSILPGYLPESKFMGNSTFNGFNAPGFAFSFGLQDRDFAQKAADRGWLTTDTINQAYIMTNLNDLTIKTTIEPIRGLRLDLTANRRYSNNLNELYFKEGDSFSAYNTRQSGFFSMTTCMIGTAFDKLSTSGTYYSETYDKFLKNREIIAQRFANNRIGITDPNTGKLYDPTPNANKEGANGYDLNSQNVLIPAFFSAYTGKSADNVFLDLFPNITKVAPNWRFSYNGLGKIKALKKFFKSVELTHTYRSTYNIGSYISNIDYQENDGISWIRDLQDNYLPEFQINSVTLNEGFSPLLGINVTLKNSLSVRLEKKKSRTLTLSLTNNQLIENHNNDWVIGLGYRFDKMDIILGSKAGAKKMSSDLNLRLDFSMRDNMAIIRRLEDNVTQLTSGQKINTIEFTADYALSQRFNVQLYYDRVVNSPYISTSYPTSNTNFGLSFRFSLSAK